MKFLVPGINLYDPNRYSPGLRLIGARVGDHDISNERDCERNREGQVVVCTERYQDFGVDGIYFHSDYTRTKLQNDIALLRLNGTIDFRPSTVRPICLPYGSAAIINHTKVRIINIHSFHSILSVGK